MPSKSNGPWQIGFAVGSTLPQTIPLPWMARPFVGRGRRIMLLLICFLSVPVPCQETLLQVAVSEKTNEIPVAQALLPCLPLLGRVCTADALHTQKDFMLCVQVLGGTTVLTVKNNHPTIYTDLACGGNLPVYPLQGYSYQEKRQVRLGRLQAFHKPVTKVPPQPSSYYESLVRENEILFYGILQLIQVICS
jgi:hypothetical protein